MAIAALVLVGWLAASAVVCGQSRPFARADDSYVRLGQMPEPPMPEPPMPVPPMQVPGIALPIQQPAEGEPSRLPLLMEPPPGLRTPRPTPETLAEFQRFIRGTVDPQNTLDLIVGRPRLLVFERAPFRTYIASDDIAAYQVITPTQISVIGREVGTTVLYLWVADPDAPGGERILSYLVRVLPDIESRFRLDAVYEALEKEINHAFPDCLVDLSLVGDQVVVRGQAKDALEATQILRLVASSVQTRQRRRDGNVNLTVSQTSYTPFNSLGEDLTVDSLDSEFLREILEGTPSIVNLLEIPGEQQVMLRVTVAEVNRTAARSIGLNFSVMNDSGTTIFQSLTGGLTGGTGTAAGVANVISMLDNGQVNLAINALRNLTLARTLAEPNLTTLNGQPASFQAGGQFPVPVVTGFTAAGLQGVTFVPFGVQLQFTPYIVDRDRVRLRISANVSTRNPDIGTSIGGANVAGLDTRNFFSTVELREGQTLAVAGLIQNNFGANADRVPFWGDLPLIGNTGGFNRTSAGEQELVILITPELVAPVDARHHGAPLPGADVIEPSDVEFYLYGRLESRRGRDYRSAARTDYRRIRAGENRCDDRFLIGPIGHAYNCLGSCEGGEVPMVVPPQFPYESLPAPVEAAPVQ